MNDYLECEEAYRQAIDNLNALERAIADICDIDTVHAIRERKKVIRKR